MRRALLAAILIAAVAAVAGATVVKGLRTMSPVTKEAAAPKGAMQLIVDSIDFRKDLTRVYCRLSRLPHTAHRIDSATLTAGTRVLAAKDIDGIEFKHYFQFEDNGSVSLEIDFAPTAVARKGSITLVTAQGTVTFPFK